MVTLKKDANHREMMDAIEEFGNTLKKGGVGLFYYAGHAVQVNGVNYLLPIGARVNKEGDVRYEGIDTGRILTEMESASNGLNIVILDACRDNPFAKSFRSASRGLAIVTNAPTGTFISYSTGAGQVARDGDGRNSPYTSALLKYMQEPGVPINDVFMNVRQKLRKEYGQVPWELSSLEGKFYFRPGRPSSSDIAATTAAPSVDYEAERRKLEAEEERIKQEAALEEKRKAIEEKKRQLKEAAEEATEQRRLAAEQRKLEKQRALEEKRRRIEEEKERLAAEKEAKRQAAAERKKGKRGTKVAMARPTEVKRKGCVENDGRFCKYTDGTVLDTKTNLMWASKDNGSDINWSNAKSYCENYRGGSYSDWRMPTQEELAGLYDTSEPRPAACMSVYNIYFATKLIDITCFATWASETRGSEAAYFGFVDGSRYWSYQSGYLSSRALPVRNAK